MPTLLSLGVGWLLSASLAKAGPRAITPQAEGDRAGDAPRRRQDPERGREAVVEPAGPPRGSSVEPAQVEATAAGEGLGWLPVIALIGAGGLQLLSLGNIAARTGQVWAESLFWLGLVTLYLPVVVRLLMPSVGRREALGLVVVLGLSLYLVKVLNSPLVFAYTDEFSHWRTANDIVQSGRLFQPNPLLPVSALFPGLEAVTAALVSLSGISIIQAGSLVVGVARLLLLAALFAIYERLTLSPRIAGLGAALYMANPNYLFFGATFAYESLALPAATVFILALLHREHLRGLLAQAGATVAALLLLYLVIWTHHLTSYALSVLLLLWLTIASFVGERAGRLQGPGGFAVIAPVASVVWLVTVGGPVVGYLLPHILSTLSEVVALATQQSGAGRELFVAAEGTVAPLWERLTGIASVALILLALPVGLIIVWRRYRDNALALALAALVMVYPASLLLRLTGRGWEIGNRSSEFVFLGMAFVVALAVAGVVRGRRLNLWTASVACAVAVVFLGGVIAGWKPSWRLPPPQVAGAPLSTVDAEALAATEWTRDVLGPGNVVAADTILMMLMGSAGEQHITTTLSEGINASWVIFAPELGPEQLRLLREGRIEYVVLDRRQTSPDPVGTSYYPGVSKERGYIKFEQANNVGKVFDSGNVQIFDVSRLSGVRGTARVP